MPDAPLYRLGVADDVQAEDSPLAAGRAQKGQQGADGVGLSGAVGAEEAEDFPRLHRQVHVLDAPRLGVKRGQAAGLDRRVSSGVRHVTFNPDRSSVVERRSAYSPSSATAAMTSVMSWPTGPTRMQRPQPTQPGRVHLSRKNLNLQVNRLRQ